MGSRLDSLEATCESVTNGYVTPRECLNRLQPSVHRKGRRELRASVVWAQAGANAGLRESDPGEPTDGAIQTWTRLRQAYADSVTASNTATHAVVDVFLNCQVK
jgi:hypothetical protein